MKFCRIICGAAAWLAVLGSVAAEEKNTPKTGAVPAKPQTAPKPGDKPGPPQLGDESTQGLGSFGKVLPLGHKNKDVKIPSFREGVPSSFLRAGTMVRIDDERMDMEKLDIRMYGETREKDLRIMMPTALYHMPTEVLSGQERSRVSRVDFDLQGDTLIFDTRTQQGKMTGHIHMIIHDSESFAPQPGKSAAPDAKKNTEPQPAEKGKEPSEKK